MIRIKLEIPESVQWPLHPANVEIRHRSLKKTEVEVLLGNKLEKPASVDLSFRHLKEYLSEYSSDALNVIEVSSIWIGYALGIRDRVYVCLRELGSSSFMDMDDYQVFLTSTGAIDFYDCRECFPVLAQIPEEKKPMANTGASMPDFFWQGTRPLDNIIGVNLAINEVPQEYGCIVYASMLAEQSFWEDFHGRMVHYLISLGQSNESSSYFIDKLMAQLAERIEEKCRLLLSY